MSGVGEREEARAPEEEGSATDVGGYPGCAIPHARWTVDDESMHRCLFAQPLERLSASERARAGDELAELSLPHDLSQAKRPRDRALQDTSTMHDNELLLRRRPASPEKESLPRSSSRRPPATDRELEVGIGGLGELVSAHADCVS